MAIEIVDFRVWRWPGNRAVIVADRGTVRPPPARLDGCTVARLAVQLAVHGWPSRLCSWPCSRPCTGDRPGCTVGSAAGRARVAVPVVQGAVQPAVHG